MPPKKSNASPKKSAEKASPAKKTITKKASKGEKKEKVPRAPSEYNLYMKARPTQTPHLARRATDQR